MPLTRRNYVLLAIGFAVILLGFVLMAGGGSDSPDQFNYAMFSPFFVEQLFIGRQVTYSSNINMTPSSVTL